MNPTDCRLARLFRSAAQGPCASEDQLPHYVEKGILSHWRLMQIPAREIWANECFVPALALCVTVLFVVQLWNFLQPPAPLTDSQFTLTAIYKIWNL